MLPQSLNKQTRIKELRQLYIAYSKDRNLVNIEWQEFFDDLAPDACNFLSDLEIDHNSNFEVNSDLTLHTNQDSRSATLDSIRALMLIRAYRVRGHLKANLDPLNITKSLDHTELKPESYGFEEKDMDRPIFIDNVLGLESATLREILVNLEATYCGTIGVQFMHIQDPEQKAWIQKTLENVLNQPDFTDMGKKAIFERLVAAETFERFLDRKYTGTKRFGLEGAEAMIPALEQILKRGGKLGLEEVIIGTAHRGRLNVLANFMGKPFEAIFSEFQGNSSQPENVQGAGDVKYHLGTSSDRTFDGKKVHLSLTANPSHLEAVNPVVVGKVRAKQDRKEDLGRRKVAALLIHGDAAFSGQGLVPETLDLSELKGYRIGGTIHFIINNQIGFTTNPVNARSGPYCSDVALMIQAPILHVNGDDPEAVVHAARIAIEFRQKFNKDIVIDMFCYRRHGHNEGDEPAFTQPTMYKAISNHPSTREIYSNKLIKENLISKEESDKFLNDWYSRLEEEYKKANSYKPVKADWFSGAWEGLDIAREKGKRRGDTSINIEKLELVGQGLTNLPKNFNVHKKLQKLIDQRKSSFEGKTPIDWSSAESLALGSLLVEGVKIRMTGQDSGRGTFSQRHAVLVDQKNDNKIILLNNIKKDQAIFEIVDSPLSEASVLGFEYGYSLAEPNALVIWEAQFGDFANGAQVIIDQFISSGESKWLRMSGLTLLLPHGYEGQGPEHSSARMERFLQLCAEDNLQIVNCTTPANYFHVLRRQMHRSFRKPVIIFTPKSLLRNKNAVSKISDITSGSWFHRVLPDPKKLLKKDKVDRVVLCSGKVFYDLVKMREENKLLNIRIIRIEQLYPFPEDAVLRELKNFSNAKIIWCQEEPKNMGAWTYISPLIEEVMIKIGSKQNRLHYAGREAQASTATGLFSRHQQEQNKLLTEALLKRTN
ncbi:MAG: 2-oxoglutarate dehydrogenase E1 component [Alphaproteobacteria bacterium MarineAlpha9_Bin3]|nr:MAG: 2-oxoglutarate dehydrogenase E1 component [Alphaproteobacteria bacterium MarineAlpha9_Bin3]